MNAPVQARLTLDFETTESPIVGRLRSDGHPDRPFEGWIGLLSALDSALAGLAGPAGGPHRQEGEVKR